MNRKIIPYLTGYFTLLFVSCYLLISYDKADLHLMLNAHHTAFADVFFKYYTVLAQWPLYIIALIPLCFHKWRWTLYYALSEGVGAIVVTLLKHIFHSPRPVAYFEEIGNTSLPLVAGVTMHHSNSFPSGHSSTFFMFFTFAALLLCQYYARSSRDSRSSSQYRMSSESRNAGSNAIIQQLTLIGLLALAVLGCYSRIYLSQHFLSDVCAGSLVGVIVPCLMFCFLGKKIIAK